MSNAVSYAPILSSLRFRGVKLFDYSINRFIRYWLARSGELPKPAHPFGTPLCHIPESPCYRRFFYMYGNFFHGSKTVKNWTVQVHRVIHWFKLIHENLDMIGICIKAAGQGKLSQARSLSSIFCANTAATLAHVSLRLHGGSVSLWSIPRCHCSQFYIYGTSCGNWCWRSFGLVCCLTPLSVLCLFVCYLSLGKRPKETI